MKRSWFILAIAIVLALVGCINDPVQTRLVYQNGQVGVITGKNADLEGGYTTSSRSIKIHYSSFTLDNRFGNTISFTSGGVIPLTTETISYTEFIKNEVEILGCNIVDGVLKMEIAAGTDDRGVYSTFRLREIYISIDNNNLYAREYLNDELNEQIYVGVDLKTNYRDQYLPSYTFTFDIPGKYLDRTGMILPYEPEYNLQINNVETVLKNDSYISFSANISRNQIVTESMDLAISTDGDLEIKTYLDGLEISNNTRFDREAWAEGNHVLTICGENEEGFVSIKEIPFQLEGGNAVNSSIDYTASDLGYQVGYPKANETGKTINAEGYSHKYSPYAILDLKIAKSEDVVIWSGEIAENLTAFMQVYDSYNDEFVTLSATKELSAQLGYRFTDPNIYAKSSENVLHVRICAANINTDIEISHQLFHVTDVQYITRSATSPNERLRTEAEGALKSMVDYLVYEKENAGLAYTVMTGDFTQSLKTAEAEFTAVTSNLLYPLIDAGVAYGVASGNHDIGALSENPNTNAGGNATDEYLVYEHYNKYLGKSIFENEPHYGGSFEDNRSHFDLFTVNGHEFLAMYLGWGSSVAGTHVSKKDVDYAKSVIEQFPERTVIIGVHEYLNALGARTATGKYIFDEIVKKHKNVMFVLSGHINGSNYSIDLMDDDSDGIKDRAVMQLLTNFQEEESLYGATFIRKIGLDFANNKMLFSLYSPFFNDHKIFVNNNALFVNNANTFAYDFNLNQSTYSLITTRIGK